MLCIYMIVTIKAYWRFGNDFIRNLCNSLLAQKNDFKIIYENTDLIKLGLPYYDSFSNKFYRYLQ
jgi:hypothetical protein